MPRYVLGALLLILSLLVNADERVFYQPVNRDAALSPTQWHTLWRETVNRGGQTLIVQWSRYGNEDFGGAQGWLANSLRIAHEQGLQLVLGLHLDDAYYQRIDELDGAGLIAYWKAQLGQSLAQQRRLRDTWSLPVSGWYLPMELDDLHFQQTDRREALHTLLHAFIDEADGPLHLSVFSTGKLSPKVQADWLDTLASLGLTVWWQDGTGTGRLPEFVRQQYAAALACHIGIIREAFRQTSMEGQPFKADPAPPQTTADCHPQAVFELHYRPWAWHLLPAPDGT
uniref:DUF4434 domain-containing protein n=1 Tax=Pseudomonas laurentiana TaxID=2364649 RepID=UPI0029C915BD|nr:DUF4434 domain-containing protein [Pseudomonas laurentiana]